MFGGLRQNLIDHGYGGAALLQGMKALDDGALAALPFVAGRFDRLQDCPQSIHQFPEVY
jgi:hypothetical protein